MDKISISRGELFSQQVDDRLREQEAVGRAQQHFDQHSAPAGYEAGSLLYHSIVYMTLAGLAGGLAAWIFSEIVQQAIRSQRETYIEYRVEAQEIFERAARGEIGNAEAQSQLDALHRRFAENPYVQLDLDESLSEEEYERRELDLLGRDLIRESVNHLMWFLAIGMTISFAITVAEPVVSRNPREVIVQGALGLVLGLAGAVVVAIFINSFYRSLLGEDVSLMRLMFARTVAWSLFGALLAIAPGAAIKNPKRLAIGLLGGILGGALGGFLFDPVALVSTDVVSRLVGIAAVGMLTGLGVGLLENAAKTGWLRVTRGLIAGKQFILYKKSTFIGSSPQCEIYLFKDPAIAPRHAVVHKTPGGYDLEVLRSETGVFVNARQTTSRTRLASGDQIQIGGVTFAFQERRAK